ncbi:hypothetical protein ACPUVO_08635 [Pseudocolwellia sp. HL-MZ19]|uniref:hypothetical protein n=1 Tax=Pseudocolwellia sp. HL-MZ19 TaxID=3400846 RepID=UPI003CFAD4FE
MNCKLVNNAIDELTVVDFRSGLENVLNNTLKAHIESCDTCEKTLQEHHSYIIKMSRSTTPEFSDTQATAMLDKVVNKAGNNIHANKSAKNDSSFFQGFIAASVLALSIFGAWNVLTPSPDQQPLIVSAEPEYFTTEVVLVIDAPEDMYDADLNIVLPQQIALEGYDNIQDLSWPVDLKAGTNTLSLPIRVNKNQNLEQPLSIMAKLYHYAEEREFEIKVNVQDMKNLQENSITSESGVSTTRA